MAIKKVYVGSLGPYLYDDTDPVNDPDGDFAGETQEAIKTDGNIDPGSASITALQSDVSDLETWQATGVSGTFTTADTPAKTVTVTDGLITSIV